jgi:photosynthetic reaction center cytochrome c subunit
MIRRILLPTALAAVSLLGLAACERPPEQSVQAGYRGTGMVAISNPRRLAELKAANTFPYEPPVVATEADAALPLAKDVYQNVQVLTDLNVTEFIRQMTSQANWIAPKEQCVYCHNLTNLASDEKYTKVVARRMLAMTRDININWQKHVVQTGVTCYTCHRGRAIPQYTWFADNGPTLRGAAANHAGQNFPARASGLTAMALDPYSPFLKDYKNLRVESTTALPTGNKASIMDTEATYALMMNISQALGVNCTFCHNSRQFALWGESAPQRAVGWYAVRMTRNLNTQYLTPLTPVFPVSRLGPTGDVAKINCETCHQGENKPLNGVSMLPAHPELARIKVPAAPVTVDSAAAADAAAVAAGTAAAATAKAATTAGGA